MKKVFLWLLVISMIIVFSLVGCKEEAAEEEVTEEEEVAEEEVAEEEGAPLDIPLSFSYDPEMSKAILADAGYVDTDGDGLVEAPDGSKIELSVIVPFGWSDWMESIKVVASGCQAAGINVIAEYPDYPQYNDAKLSGTFEMMINNDQQMSSTPWTYYDWMFQNPITDIATMQNGNYGRYDNQAAFDLVDELDRIPVDDVEGMKAVISELQRIMLTDLPLIPLWYNGMWSQTSNAVWTNWPSSVEDASHYLAATWRGYWNMTGILMLCALEPVEGVEPGTGTFPRNETLYTSGTQWGPPSSWNPYNTSGSAMGTFGLCYESLFLYDPLADEYVPWLAESGEWISDSVYELKLRQDINWSDGEPFNAEDVKFTFDLADTAAIGLTPIWNFLSSVDIVDDYTVDLNFNDPGYQEISWYIYNNPIVPEHLWASKTVEEVTTGIGENPIGTGAYLFEASDQGKMVWKKNDNWWAINALDLDPKPTYIVDLVNSSNNVALGQVIMGTYDLNNNFLPGIASIVGGGYGISTYYPEPPYMISGNTAWLLLNNTIKPMDDVAFRKAVAFAIDTDQIVNIVYGNIVSKANSTGLLPIWDQYIDKAMLEE